MKIGLFMGTALVAAFPLTLCAQQEPRGFHSVACLKVKPGKFVEAQKWLAEDIHKLQQALVDSGRISEWFLLSGVIPQGSAATCDYYSVAIYPGLPPAPVGMEGLGAALKKAGVGNSAQEFVEKSSGVVDVVYGELWQNQLAVGDLRKGDYVYLCRMKVTKRSEYFEAQKKIWVPIAEQYVKDGHMRGWYMNSPILPGGSEVKYQSLTVDVFPSWEEAMKYPADVENTFKKAHPGKDMTHTFEYMTLFDLAVRDLCHVQDLVMGGT